MLSEIFGWTAQEPRMLQLVWVQIAIGVLLFVLEQRSRDALTSFLSPVMQRRLTAQATRERTIVRTVLVTASLLFCVEALTRPQAPGQTETVTASQASADVMFVLDVSRSMLAEDAAPNRLARAKAEIGQLVSRLEEHRVGLVVFAGRAVQACPLTPDHSFFTTVLSTIDTRSAGKGGSRVGEAIKAGLRGFPVGQGAKLIVLISDGDDQDPYSEEAAKAARDAGVRIVTIGYGNPDGSQITLVDPQTKARTTLMHDGQPVISKLNEEQLKKIALVTEGLYVPARTGAIDLDDIMKSHVDPLVKSAEEQAQREIPAEKFSFFVTLALLYLLLALFVGTVDRRAS